MHFPRDKAPILVETLERRVLFTIPGTSLDIWHTYAQATSDLNTIHNAYPNLTRLMSIGKTVQNRDMWAMEITDNPGVEEDEPESYYQGSMHGDEPVGMENCFHFIQYLLENYGGTSGDGPRVTNLVNNMDIWVVPNMNWDGYSRSGGAWRYNANGVDLNRDFPEWTTTPGGYGNVLDGPAPSTSGRAVETVNMINFRKAHDFVASANFHTGSLVVNYPWDTNNDGVANFAYTPDDALFREMSLTYSRQNTPMYNGGGGFSQGITNGDHWYEVAGGMQDWSYLYTGDNEVTIELNTTKYPSASTLPGLWNNNRESMLQYLESANWGVRGIVSGAGGAPLAAKITLVSPAPSPAPDSHHPATHSVFTDPDVGDYHRMLLPGTYALKFEAAGYQTQTISNIVIGGKTNDPNATLRLDVQMQPLDVTPPIASNGAFDFDTPGQDVAVQFSENVLPSLSESDLVLKNLTTNTTIATSAIHLSYDSSTNLATFSFPAYPTGLSDGDYRATIPAAGVQDSANNSMASDYSFTFFALTADANRDHAVDTVDLNILAANFGQSGRTFSQGDFNYDTSVDTIDFNLLAGKFGASQAPLPASATASPIIRTRIPLSDAAVIDTLQEPDVLLADPST